MISTRAEGRVVAANFALADLVRGEGTGTTSTFHQNKHGGRGGFSFTKLFVCV